MAVDPADARQRLWERYDAGQASAEEVEARLVLLDRAGDDVDAIRAAVDGPIPLRRRVASRTGIAIGLAVLVLLLIGGAVVAGEDGGGTPTATSNGGPSGGVVVNNPIPALPAPPALPPGPTVVEAGVAVAGEPAECATADTAEVPTDAPANPALLSEPAFVPEGYEVDDDETITPGSDADVTMSIAAGDPLPDEIRARVLGGDLGVRMRAWRYADAAAAGDAARAAALAGCSYDAQPFEVAGRPEIGGSVVTGVIPTTAFASWRLDDRRFMVAVESFTDDPEHVEEARQLAGAIAAAELDAARNPPPAPAP